MSGTIPNLGDWCRSHPYPKDEAMTDTTVADAHAAWQLETILSGLICRTKERLQRIIDTRNYDDMRDELARLQALEACRRHALAANPEPLDAQAAHGYRILNQHLEAKQ